MKPRYTSILSFTLIIIALALGWQVLDYFFLSATFSGGAPECTENGGFCYPFLLDKGIFILFGSYPRELLWRPILLLVVLFSLIFYGRDLTRWKGKYLLAWPVSLICFHPLMKGGFFGLTEVPMNLWGGLPLTILLAFWGIIISYPIGIILALGRRSHLNFVRTISTVYIELIRGVPLVSLLFMCSVMLPLFLPNDMVIDKFWRAQWALIAFSSAYMAEVVRGGLQAIAQGQYEAAHSLGLTKIQALLFIILPQALKIVIPPTVSTAISIFKDTSLVIIISLFDLLYTMKLAQKDLIWLGRDTEAYIFVGLIYFLFCFCLSKYGHALEKQLDTSGN